MSDKNVLASLRDRYKVLEDELTAMQQQHTTLTAEHSQQCSTSLEEALKSLLEVIKCVRKADKRLIAWHGRSDTLKSMLRHIGIDRRTEVVIEKKTQKLKVKVTDVESKFSSANHAVASSLQDTESLRTKFAHFSTHSVDVVSRETLSEHDKLNASKEGIEGQIVRQRWEKNRAANVMSEAAESVNEAKRKHTNAVVTGGVLTAGSLLGTGVAAVAAVACPMSLLFAGSALLAAGAGSMACAVNQEAKVLEAKHEALSSVLAEHESSIRVLESKLRALNSKRGECAHDIRLVQSLQAKAVSFRKIVQESLDYLRATKLSLDKMSLKLSEVIRKLQECQYEEARRGLAERLQEVMTTIQAVPQKKLAGIPEADIQKAMTHLMDIKKKTTQVLGIAKMASVS